LRWRVWIQFWGKRLPERKFRWNVTLNDYVEKIIEAASKVGSPFIFVSHSAGGNAASQATSDSPRYFSNLIYISACLPINGESLASLSSKNTINNIQSAINQI